MPIKRRTFSADAISVRRPKPEVRLDLSPAEQLTRRTRNRYSYIPNEFIDALGNLPNMGSTIHKETFFEDLVVQLIPKVYLIKDYPITLRLAYVEPTYSNKVPQGSIRISAILVFAHTDSDKIHPPFVRIVTDELVKRLRHVGGFINRLIVDRKFPGEPYDAKLFETDHLVTSLFRPD